MKSRTIVEIGGMISVIGSLIFVGVEISQNTAAVRGATQQEERKNGFEPEFVTFYEALRDGEK